MDQTDKLGSGKSVSRWLLLALTMASFLASLPAWSAGESGQWRATVRERLADVDAAFPGELGVYIKDLESGETLSFKAEEVWYLASGIKLPVAIEVMRGIERGEFTLDTKVTLKASDYIDGAGETNWQPPGARLSVGYLLGQMLTHSDNTATDVLIRVVGLERVNKVAQELAGEDFRITTLVDVRRHVYGGLHPDAFGLTGMDFIALRKLDDEGRHIAKLVDLLGVDESELLMDDLDSAYAAYYATRLNSSRLSAYGVLLEKLVEGVALTPESTDYLLSVMRQVETGKQRIQAGLAGSVSFAHKTGTKHRRACDFGIATLGQEANARRVVIAACTRGALSVARSESALRKVGEAVSDSRLLRRPLGISNARQLP